MAETVSDLMLQRLIDWGVDTIFGLPGDGINGFMEALRKREGEVRFVHVRHEETAALAAVGYAKFSGRLGVCLSTAAPGAVHLLNGLYDAAVDQAPVLAITGMTYHDLIGTHYLQDINHDALFEHVCGYSQRIMGSTHAVNVVDLACRTALTQRTSAHIAVPIDYQVQEVGADERYKRNVPGHTTTSFQPPVRIPERELLERAARLLADRRRVVILAGAGARGAGDELEQVAERLKAPIVKPMLGKDCVPDDSLYTTGSIGVVGTRPSSDAMAGCDALLIVGSSFPYIEFLPQPEQALGIQIDDRPERIGLRYPVELGLVGDAKATLRALFPLLPENDDRSFLEQAQAGMRDWWELMEEQGTSEQTPMKPQLVAWELGKHLRDDAIVCGDSGSLTMMLGELATLRQERLPVKVVVVKNGYLGLILWEQLVFLGNPQYGVDFSDVDFAKVAEGCGIEGVSIDDPTRCGEQLRAALAGEGPALIECVCDPYEPPNPPKITRDQALNLAEGLARGEPSRQRIALTIGRDMLDERTFAASPYGVTERLKDRVKDVLPGGGGGGGGDA